jgi:outer membrane protein assembly factor BamB
VHKLRARDGTPIWKSARVDAKDAHVLSVVARESDYLVESTPFVRGSLVVRSTIDGQVIASGRGKVVSVRSGIAYVAEDATLLLYALPNLEELADFDVGSDVLDVAVGADAIAVVKTDASRTRYPRRGSTWVEGWSRAGVRVWGPALLGESARDHHGLVQPDAEHCYVSQGGRVTALRIADGRVLWESAPDGELFEAGPTRPSARRGSNRQLVVLGRQGRSLFVLDAETGELVVRYDLNDTLNSLFVHGNELIGTDLDHEIHAFRLPGG